LHGGICATQSGEEEKKAERRPHLASLCETLPEAEKWRRQILKEITKKVKFLEYVREILPSGCVPNISLVFRE
jgi:hypothetical protein